MEPGEQKESKSKEKKKEKKEKKDKKDKKSKKDKKDKKNEIKDPNEAMYLNMSDTNAIYQEVDKIIEKLFSDKS